MSTLLQAQKMTSSNKYYILLDLFLSVQRENRFFYHSSPYRSPIATHGAFIITQMRERVFFADNRHLHDTTHSPAPRPITLSRGIDFNNCNGTVATNRLTGPRGCIGCIKSRTHTATGAAAFVRSTRCEQYTQQLATSVTTIE